MSLLLGTKRALLRSEVKYLLRDRFVDTRAAGAVNGTIATPGPGTRVVVDTGNVLTIAGGVATCAVPTGIADPLVSYGPYTRTAGLVLLGGDMNMADRLYLGFDANQIGAPSRDAVYPFGTTLYCSDNAAPLVATVAITITTDYEFAVVLRASGGFMFIKGGAFAVWTLAWIGDADTTATVYVGLAWRVGAMSGDNIRIPDILCTGIRPPVSDSFNRANAAIGTSDGAGCEETAAATPAWESGGATWTVAGNEAVNTPTEGGDVVVNGDFAADTDWTKSAAQVTIAGGFLVFTVAPQFSYGRSIVAPLTLGGWYSYSIDVAGLAAERCYLQEGGNTLIRSIAVDGTHTGTVRITETGGSQGDITIKSGDAGASFTVDNVIFQPLTLNTLFTDLVTSVADVIATVELDTVVAGTQAGLVLNLDDATTPANFIIAYHDGTAAVLEKCVAGTYTSVISAAAAYAAGAEIRVVKDGTSYSLYYNNAQIGTTQTVADAGIISNTNHGLFSTYSGNQLDNFYVFSRTGYNILDTW